MTIKTLAHHAADAIVRRFPVDRLPTRWNGTWLRVPRASWESVYRNYELYLAAVLRQHLPVGGCFLDVGAHIGWWSMFAANQVGPAGRVLALEPSGAFNILTANTAAYSQVTALQMGAGAQTGRATFFGQGASSSASFVEEVTAINQRYQAEVPITPVSVPICTLDQLVKTHALHPSLVKIDVEGFEAKVLEGAASLLSSGVPCVIEVHPLQVALSGDTVEAVHDRLLARGYVLNVLHSNPNGLYTLMARRG